jgi:HEPN domain-containing protein
MRDEAEPWWEQSQADYANAKRVKELDQWYLVAFLIQQAIEKALKAVHVEVERQLPDRT